MAMLAEPRRKQKIINLRAKNSEWSKDTNKFGQRMLEKMGWTSGKGLGAKENGIVEHVVARYKNDEKGLGFEDKNDQWTKHEDDFNSLLANLSNANEDTKVILHSGVSLEDKSKKSKARIHYHKFTRGKDLSRYSEKDLANIFGKKSFKEKEQTEINDSNDNDATPTEQVFTEKGSMEDYFKNKMAAFKKKTKTINKNHDLDTECADYDDSVNCGFQGFSGTTISVCNSDNEISLNIIGNNSKVIENVNDNNCENESKIKKKKKKKSREEPQEIACDNAIEDNFSINKGASKALKRKQEDKNEDIKKKKVSKKKQQDPEELQDNDIDNTVQKVKKKKKKKDKDL